MSNYSLNDETIEDFFGDFIWGLVCNYDIMVLGQISTIVLKYILTVWLKLWSEKSRQ